MFKILRKNERPQSDRIILTDAIIDRNVSRLWRPFSECYYQDQYRFKPIIAECESRRMSQRRQSATFVETPTYRI